MIALLVMATVLLAAFALIQVWSSSRALIPPRIFIQRSIASGLLSISCLGAAQTLMSEYCVSSNQLATNIGQSTIFQSGIKPLRASLQSGAAPNC